MKFAEFILEVETEPVEYPLSAKEVEDMVQRIYNINREFYKDQGYTYWRDWLNRDDPENIADTLSGWYQQLEKWLSQLSEDMSVRDLIRAYKAGQLRPNPTQQYRHQSIPIQSTGKFDALPWSPPQKLKVTDEQAKQIFSLACQRATKSSQPQVFEARKQLFLLYYSDSQLAQRLGISKTELGRRIRSYTGYSATARDLEQSLNRGVPDEHQWAGISNSTFMSQMSLSHEDLESLVKGIEVTDGGVAAWRTDRGEAIRRYIGRAFLGIDTTIRYDDLSFRVGQIEPGPGKDRPPKGRYDNTKKLVLISDLNPNTVAHEIGHYLDHKFSEQFGFNYGSFTSNSYISSDNESLRREIPLPQLEWADRFRKFIHNLMDKGDITNEYSQTPGEVFSRFIDYFCRWTEQKAIGKKEVSQWNDQFWSDHFDQRDCQTWVKLLQEKSYLDARYPIKRRRR